MLYNVVNHEIQHKSSPTQYLAHQYVKNSIHCTWLNMWTNQSRIISLDTNLFFLEENIRSYYGWHEKKRDKVKSLGNQHNLVNIECITLSARVPWYINTAQQVPGSDRFLLATSEFFYMSVQTFYLLEPRTVCWLQRSGWHGHLGSPSGTLGDVAQPSVTL